MTFFKSGGTAAGGGGGDMTLLGEQVLGADATSMSVSSLAATHKDLLIYCRSATDRTAAATDDIHMTVGDGTLDTGTNSYDWMRVYEGSASGSVNDVGDVKIDCGISAARLTATPDTDSFGLTIVHFADYATTGYNRPFQGTTTMFNPNSNIKYRSRFWGEWRNTAGVLDIVRFVPSLGTNFKAGSYLRVYGCGT